MPKARPNRAAPFQLTAAPVRGIGNNRQLSERTVMHIPGPWRAVRAPQSNDDTHSIEARDGHVASIARCSTDVAPCLKAEANARLIAHAPALAGALSALVNWEQNMGGWEAPCWQRARRVLARTTGLATAAVSAPPATTHELLDKAGCAHGWNKHTELSLLLDFLDEEIRIDPALGTRLQAYLEEAS